MKDIQLKNLSLDIMEVLDNGRAITEEDLLWFIDAVYEVSAGKLKSNYEFDMLCHDIHAKFAYTDMPDEHSFCVGALWGILKEGEIVRNERHLSYRKIGQISSEACDLLAENAKLRELVRDYRFCAHTCDCLRCPHGRFCDLHLDSRYSELGIEVN